MPHPRRTQTAAGDQPRRAPGSADNKSSADSRTSTRSPPDGPPCYEKTQVTAIAYSSPTPQPGQIGPRRWQRLWYGSPGPGTISATATCSPSALTRHSAGSPGSRASSRRHALPDEPVMTHEVAPYAPPVDASRPGTKQFRRHQEHQPVRQSHFAVCPLQLAAVASRTPIVPVPGTPFAFARPQQPSFGPGIGAKGAAA